MPIIENLALCTDCTMAAVNGDYSGLDYHYNNEDAEKRMEEIEDGLSRLGPGLIHSGRDYDEFSLRACSCCGTKLAGQREFFHLMR